LMEIISYLYMDSEMPSSTLRKTKTDVLKRQKSNLNNL